MLQGSNHLKTCKVLSSNHSVFHKRYNFSPNCEMSRHFVVCSCLMCLFCFWIRWKQTCLDYNSRFDKTSDIVTPIWSEVRSSTALSVFLKHVWRLCSNEDGTQEVKNRYFGHLTDYHCVLPRCCHCCCGRTVVAVAATEMLQLPLDWTEAASAGLGRRERTTTPVL